MPTTIAITGKGGTGKTVLSALTVLTLLEHNLRPLLAVDADPNLNLDAVLGMHVDDTVGSVREEARVQAVGGDSHMPTAQFLDYRIRESLVEGKGFDLIAMGRPEGPGCYCYANEMLRNVLDRLAKTYKMVVVDCEAGLEHMSRRTTGDVDLLILLSDPSVRGIQTARRALDLMREVRTTPGEARLVINKVSGELSESLRQTARDLDLPISACLPVDEQVAALDAAGRPLTELPPDSPMLQAVARLLADCGLISLPQPLPA
jgi:CO dehydrogenase maturation factor